MEYAQHSHTLRYVVLEFVCRHFIFHSTKVQTFSLFHIATCMRFSNRLPEYVLAIQLVQKRASRLVSRSSTLWIACPNLYG